jgi:hypothetical protein
MQRLTESPRAQRYVMSAPVMYRQEGTSGWMPGWTLNISRSGVLFEASAPVPEEAGIEFLLFLPSLGLRGRTRVRCAGRVVRHRLVTGTAVSMAATIDAYDFLGVVAEPVEDDAVWSGSWAQRAATRQ